MVFTFKREPSKTSKNEKRPLKNLFFYEKKGSEKRTKVIIIFFVRTSSTFLIAIKIKKVVGPTDEYVRDES